jgi:3D (Asp-Asp-Asp) domain-containing protein
MTIILILVGTLWITGCTDTGDLTKSETDPRVGITCAAPPWIPFGTHLIIDGVPGEWVVEDWTAKRFRHNTVDLYMKDRKTAIKWGRKPRKVWIKKMITISK